jgi:hypothetical protein
MLVSTIWSFFFLGAGGSLLAWGGCKANSLCLSWNGTIGVCFFLWVLYTITAVVAGLDLRAQIQALKGTPPGVPARESWRENLAGSTEPRGCNMIVDGWQHVYLAAFKAIECISWESMLPGMHRSLESTHASIHSTKAYCPGADVCGLVLCFHCLCCCPAAAGTPKAGNTGTGSKPGTPTKASQSGTKVNATAFPATAAVHAAPSGPEAV